MRSRQFMAFGFALLGIVVIVVQLLTPPEAKCNGDDGDLWSAVVASMAATLLFVVATLAAVKWRTKWEALGCAAAVALVGGGVLLVWLAFGRVIGPCLD